MDLTAATAVAEPDRLVGADRVLAIPAEPARHADGIGLDEMARALAALRRAGFAGQDGRGRYVLGDEFRRLLSPRVPTGAVSVSAPAYRTPPARLVDEVTVIRATVSG